MGFDQAVEFVLAHEGGYAHDPRDAGGETNFGISKKAYPGVDIRNLTREGAKLIYKRDYWDMMRCDELDSRVAMVVFDTGVNCGVYRAAVILQMACNERLRGSGRELFLDGSIGPKTIEAANSFPDVADMMLLKRLVFYRNLIRRNHEQAAFLSGWVNRVLDLHLEVTK